MEVYLPSDYAHEMCGVCGDFNFDPSNDLILGPKCVGDGEPGSLVMAYLHYTEPKGTQKRFSFFDLCLC